MLGPICTILSWISGVIRSFTIWIFNKVQKNMFKNLKFEEKKCVKLEL